MTDSRCECEKMLDTLEPAQELPRCPNGVCERTRQLTCWEWARPSVPYPEDRLVDLGDCYHQESTEELVANPLRVRWRANMPDGGHVSANSFPVWPMCPDDAPFFELAVVISQYCEETAEGLADHWRKQDVWERCVREYIHGCQMIPSQFRSGSGEKVALNSAAALLRFRGVPPNAAAYLLKDACDLEAEWYAQGQLSERLLAGCTIPQVKAGRRAYVRSFVVRPTRWGKLVGTGGFRVCSEVVLPDAAYTSADLWLAAGQAVAHHAEWAAEVFDAESARPLDLRRGNSGHGRAASTCPDSDILDFLHGKIDSKTLYRLKIVQRRKELGRQTTTDEEKRLKNATRAKANRWRKLIE